MTQIEIEKRELRGISLKTIYAVILATVTIVVAVMGSYSSLKGQMNDTQNQIQSIQNAKDADVKYNDLRMRQLEQSQNAIQLQLKELSQRIDQLIKK